MLCIQTPRDARTTHPVNFALSWNSVLDSRDGPLSHLDIMHQLYFAGDNQEMVHLS